MRFGSFVEVFREPLGFWLVSGASRILASFGSFFGEFDSVREPLVSGV